MSLSAGVRLGPYEILSALGAGGMGEVYRARDTKLNRDVAIKVLLASVASDPDRLARFSREAQVLASLNHPNIAHIHGLEEADGVTALILELVEGEDLAQRIARGPIPMDEALPIARQIAEALEAAHEHGIIHRDLKPANIKVRPDGTVKVLDFGLAKALDPSAASSTTAMNSPTLTSPAMMTGVGVILGTAAYMSPEQAKGRATDKRSDVWAFGCVLYEMLTGRRAFDGEDISETLAAILREDTDWATLPKSTPVSVRRLIARCLHRDVRQRLRDIGEARIVLADPAALSRADTGAVTSLAPARPLWRRAMPVLLAAILAGALASATIVYLRPSTDPPIVTRFRFTPATGQVFPAGTRQMVAISPDGSRIAYLANAAGLYIRSMSELEPRLIARGDTNQAVLSPVFSPDGESVAFWSGTDQTIKRVAVSGGSPVTLCSAEQPFGINWDSSGIIFGQGAKGIMRVAAHGGAPEVLIAIRDGEFAHGPQLLPGGGAVLFTLATGTALSRWDNATIVAQSLATGERTVLVSGGSDARYLPSGHLVYAHEGIVFAMPMDVRRLAVTGGPVPVVEGVRRGAQNITGAAQFDVSRTGSLIYVPGPVSTAAEQADLAWVDRTGAIEPLRLTAAAYQHPRISPNGQQLAVTTEDAKSAAIWVHDLARATAMRQLTFGGRNRFSAWAPNGERIAFQSDREGDLGIFSQRADGSGGAERLTRADQGAAHVPESWSPEGEQLLFSITKGASVSLWTYDLKNQKVTPVSDVQSTRPLNATFSPNGRWVAYTMSDASVEGESRIYVRPFPVTAAKYVVSRSIHPIWSRDGRELMSQPQGGQFAVQTITTEPSFAFGAPMPLSRGGAVTTGPATQRNHDMAPDGRFLVVLAGGQTVLAGFPQIQVVLNWFEELNAKAPPPR